MPTGAAVRLMEHADVLGIAEGIETALSASIAVQRPVLGCADRRAQECGRRPPTVKTVFVFGDNDESSTGQAAA